MGGQKTQGTEDTPSVSHPSTWLSKRQLPVVLLGATSLWLPVYALAHLNPILPHEYMASNWRPTWVLFDLCVAALAAADCVLLIIRSRFLPVLAGVTAGCFLCDAWFDCMTSRGSPASLTDLAGEVPSAALCIWIGFTGLRSKTSADAA